MPDLAEKLSNERLSVALLVLNVIGAVVYVAAASRAWVIPEERGLNSVTGEPLIWALSIFPIWAVFLLVNLTWGLAILARRRWRSGRLMLLTILIWFVAAWIDFAHH